MFAFFRHLMPPFVLPQKLMFFGVYRNKTIMKAALTDHADETANRFVYKRIF
jgi:hypothetical protein